MLLDNHYIVQEHIRKSGRIFRAGTIRSFRSSRTAHSHTIRGIRARHRADRAYEGHITLDNITLFVREYQRNAKLSW